MYNGEPGKVTNAIVAEKVMGWKYVPEEREGIISSQGEGWTDGATFYKAGEWSPSTNLVDAFQVVNKMLDDGFIYRIEGKTLGGEHYASFDNVGAYHSELEHAICLAALAAVETVES